MSSKGKATNAFIRSCWCGHCLNSRKHVSFPLDLMAILALRSDFFPPLAPSFIGTGRSAFPTISQFWKGDDTHIIFLEHLCYLDVTCANTSRHTPLTLHILHTHNSPLYAFCKDSNNTKMPNVNSEMFYFNFLVLFSRGKQHWHFSMCLFSLFHVYTLERYTVWYPSRVISMLHLYLYLYLKKTQISLY